LFVDKDGDTHRDGFLQTYGVTGGEQFHDHRMPIRSGGECPWAWR
jgi:hypothetical protein